VGDLGPGSGAGLGDRAGCRVVRGVPGQGLGSPTLSDAASAVGVECGVCVERCPFDVDILAKMREAVEVFEKQAAQERRPRKSVICVRPRGGVLYQHPRLAQQWAALPAASVRRHA
jgi:ferredoxin